MNNKHVPKSIIVIFGATGDLARRKLYPSIYRLYRNKKIGDNFAVIGVARRPWTDEVLRENVQKSVEEQNNVDIDHMDEFLSHFYYHSLDVQNTSAYEALKEKIVKLEDTYLTEGNRVFYLAMAPEFFGTIANHLKHYGFKSDEGWTRLVIEKPFGHDLPSAQELNEKIRAAFDENEIYRIDHYLGKEMVQNIEVIRFANGIFEHLWNNRFISNIQVTSSELLGVEERAHFYDQYGATRDMVQNHMLQMVSLLAMEPPINLTTDEIRSEKIKVLRALRKIEGDEVHKNFVRGQYGKGVIEGKEVPSYRSEDSLLAQSNTETFVAGRLMIDNYRWAGVPIYIRTGKRMAAKSTRIVVEFKDIPMNLYYKNKSVKHPNLLVINIQPNEGITLHLNAKEAGTGSFARPVQLTYHSNEIDGINTPEEYEKLLYDCMLGDATSFTHWDEVSLAWEFVDPILEVWENEDANFPNYEAGSMGPKEADKLLKQDGFHWWSITD